MESIPPWHSLTSALPDSREQQEVSRLRGSPQHPQSLFISPVLSYLNENPRLRDERIHFWHFSAKSSIGTRIKLRWESRALRSLSITALCFFTACLGGKPWSIQAAVRESESWKHRGTAVIIRLPSQVSLIQSITACSRVCACVCVNTGRRSYSHPRLPPKNGPRIAANHASAAAEPRRAAALSLVESDTKWEGPSMLVLEVGKCTMCSKFEDDMKKNVERKEWWWW